MRRHDYEDDLFSEKTGRQYFLTDNKHGGKCI